MTVFGADPWGQVTGLIAACCIDNPALATEVDLDDLAKGPARSLVGIIADRYSSGRPADLAALVADEAGRDISSVGGKAFLFDLAAREHLLASFGRYLVEARRLSAESALQEEVKRPEGPRPERVTQLAALLEVRGDESAAQPWPPLQPVEPHLPEFPVRVLPAVLRDWVGATTTALQVPPDLVAIAALGAVSAAAVGGFEVIAREGWREAIGLYAAVVLPSGERKSPVLSAAARPLYAVERGLAAEAKPRVAEAHAHRETLEKRRAAAIADAARAKPDTDRIGLEEKVRRLSVELDALTVEEVPRLLVDDATPEALVALLGQHQRIAVMSAEGGLLGTLAGRYARGEPNLDAVLKAYSGEPIRVDRRGSTSPIYVDRPAMSLCLAVQPQVLEEVNARRDMTGRGFLARFLVAMPRTALGHRLLEPPPVPQQVTSDFEQTVSGIAQTAARIARTPEGTSSGSFGSGFGVAELRLGEEAQAELRAFRAVLEPRLAPVDGDLHAVADWAGKLPGAVVRIAGLLHLASGGDDAAAISAGTMRSAVAIGEYLIPHAVAALSAAQGAYDSLARQRAALGWIGRLQEDVFSLREAWRGLRGARFGDTATVEATLEDLAARGYLRTLPDPRRSVGRPPSRRFQVRPDLNEDQPDGNCTAPVEDAHGRPAHPAHTSGRA